MPSGAVSGKGIRMVCVELPVYCWYQANAAQLNPPRMTRSRKVRKRSTRLDDEGGGGGGVLFSPSDGFPVC